MSHRITPHPTEPEPPIRILVVDDDDPFAEALALTLSAVDGFEVVGCARDGEQALGAARALAPDVVLMDLQMPVVDGVEATRRLGHRLPRAVVVAVSGSARGPDIERAFEAGAAAFVSKGTPLLELARTVVDVARRRPLLPERSPLDEAHDRSAA